ncbi:MAG: tetratricopeptide repeat protein [Terriglobales bacterium]
MSSVPPLVNDRSPTTHLGAARGAVLAVTVLLLARPWPSSAQMTPQQVLDTAQPVATLLEARQPDQALARANQAIAQAPGLAILYIFRAAAEVQLNQWTPARNDCNRAVAMQPTMGVMAAIVLAHSPVRTDVEQARSEVWNVFEHADGQTDTMAAIVLSSLYTPVELVPLLHSASLSEARRWHGLETMLLWQLQPEQYARPVSQLWMGLPLPAEPRTLSPKQRAAVVDAMLHQADAVFGDQPELDAVHIGWLLHQQRPTEAWSLGRQHMALHPGDTALALATEHAATQLATTQLAADDPQRALQTLGPAGDADTTETVVLRARVADQLGQFQEGLALIQQASLRQSAPPASPIASSFDLALDTSLQDLAQRTDLLYWQGRLAFDAGDYQTAASAMAYSNQVQHLVNPRAQFILAMAQEKSSQREAAQKSWAQMLEMSRYSIFEPLAVAGLKRIAKPTEVRPRARYGIEGYLVQVHCRQGKAVGVRLVNGSLEYPLRLPAAPNPLIKIPGCGTFPEPGWYRGWGKPLLDQMPRYTGEVETLELTNRLIGPPHPRAPRPR